MSKKTKYTMHMDAKYDYLEIIDVPALVEACKDDWYNQTVCQVNECVVRLGILKGEFHWHKHDEEDEFFFVLEGQFLIDLEKETIPLGQHQGYTIPKGVVHRTRAPEKAVVLMVERSTVKPMGDE
jgi:mannose-6-phosphate isomerase-like protein (cupin superfamily)